MIARAVFAMLAIVCGLALLGQGEAPPAAAAPAKAAAASFGWVDVLVDSSETRLAAYQVEVKPAGVSGDLRVVGVEGGQAGPFAAAPYYDPEAMRGERVIVAAVSTKPAAELPLYEHRVARIHLRWTGEKRPELTAVLIAAGDEQGQGIKASVRLVDGNADAPAPAPAPKKPGDGQ